MTLEIKVKNIIKLVVIAISLSACGGDDDAGLISAENARTNRLGFPAGSSVDIGAPPEPTFQQDDVTVLTPTATTVYTLLAFAITAQLSSTQ